MLCTAGRFEFFEHTADVGIRATGATLGEAFAAAALGLFSHVADPSRVVEKGEVRVDLTGDSPEDLLHAWLEELRFVAETRVLLFARFEAEVSGPPWRVVGHAYGETYDPERHGHIHEVKAVTRHGLVVRPEPPLVEVVLDI